MLHSKTLLIGGVTASGKSELAIRIAERLGGVIINADSTQLYKDLPILTARPDAADQARVAHELYGILAADQASSVASWLKAARAKIADVKTMGRLPIVVGGTGLYLSALQHGLSPMPAIDADLRQQLRKLDLTEVNARLAQADPEIHASLNLADRQRRLRALEVIEGTGRSLRYWQSRPLAGGETGLVSCVLLPERAQTRARARLRMELMVERGALGEIEALQQRVGDPLKLPIGKTLGLAQLLSHLDGLISLTDAIDAASIKIGQYIKRQEVWFRGQAKDARIVAGFGVDPAAVDAVLSMLQVDPGH